MVKLHRKVIDELAMVANLPDGVFAYGEWIIFQDVHRLLFGMCEMYTNVPECERRSRLFQAVQKVTLTSSVQITDDQGISALEHMLQQMHIKNLKL